MKPPLHSIVVIGSDAPATHAATSAARRLFPRSAIGQTTEWNAPTDPAAESTTGLLVFVAPAPDEIDRAIRILDARGWPRWAVVAAGEPDLTTDSHVVRVPFAEWNESTLSAALSAAVRLHAMKAANVQLAGDLRTISRRLGHDVRSPLNCISTAGEAMKEPDEPADSPRSIFALSIANSVDEVVHLVDRISFILKATANPTPPQPVVMEEIVWGALQRLESRFNQAGITVTRPPKWPLVEGVPAWLDVIWTNLLTNSLLHAGPKIHIELGWEQRGGEYRFWIRDTGKGVPANRQNRLFYPLDRLSQLNAPRGFGLSIVHRLVELQGGQCGYEPGASGGGTFFFTLPFTGLA